MVLSPAGPQLSRVLLSYLVALVQAGPLASRPSPWLLVLQVLPILRSSSSPLFLPSYLRTQVTLLQEACLPGMLSVGYFSDLCYCQWSLSPPENVQRRDGWSMFHGAGQDLASHGSCSRTVISLVQQGPASPYFQILSSLPLVLSVVLNKYPCPSMALCRGRNENPWECPAPLGSSC